MRFLLLGKIFVSYLCTFFRCLFCILTEVIRLIKWRLNKDLLFSLFPERKINTKVHVKVDKENKLWKKKTTFTEKKNCSDCSRSYTLSDQEEGWGSRRYNVLQHVTIPTGCLCDGQFSFVVSEDIFSCFLCWFNEMTEKRSQKNKRSTYNFYDKSFQWYSSQRLASSNCIRNEKQK